MDEGAGSEEEAGTAALVEAAMAAAVPPDAIDTGIAIFLLVAGVGFLVVSSLAMMLFFRQRNAFEIRARSAYLAMLNGLSHMAMLVIVVVHQVPEIFLHVRVNIHATFTVIFFAVACNTCCYGSRTIRLAVLYSPNARKAAPWLIPERNHVVICLLLAAASATVPLYDRGQVMDGALGEWEYFVLVSDHLWIVTFSSQAIVLLLNPLAWFIDDIFGVGPELRAMIIVQLMTTLTGRIAEEYAAPDILRWINSQRMGFLGAVIMISISVILPTRRRLLRPLQSSDPKVVEALERRKTMAAEWGNSAGAWAPGLTVATGGGGYSQFPSMISPSTQSSSAGSPGPWTYERVMSTPEVSTAFGEFSRKALCQESFLFLEDATKFQAQSFRDVEPEAADDNKDTDGDSNGNDVDDSAERGRNSSRGEDIQQQLTFFSKIIQEYIVDGAPNEINISCKDKNDILDVYNNVRGGELGFRELPASEKRLVFARAYAEVRFMLESNLMLKFVSTEEFGKALTAVRQKSKKTVDA